MPRISKKAKRIVDASLSRLNSAKSFMNPKKLKDFEVDRLLERELSLSDLRIVFLSDSGLKHLDSIVDAVHDADMLEESATFSDIWRGCRDLLQVFLSSGRYPENAEEFLELLIANIALKIGRRTHIVRLFGIKLDGIDHLDLGAMTIVPPSRKHLDDLGLRYNSNHIANILEDDKGFLWLQGSELGTPAACLKKFRLHAELAVGMLAICAGSMFQRGADAFRIGIVMNPEQASGNAAWLSWSDSERYVTPTLVMHGGQLLNITPNLRQDLGDATHFVRALQMLQASKQTELEHAIVRGVYWFSDAHRDLNPVMRFIKYWSCIETFFSEESGKIVKAVSTGLAVALVYGGFHFVPPTEYLDVKKKAARLYKLRSKALHDGLFDHISENDTALLSKWAAWLLISVMSFVERGYTQLSEIRGDMFEIDRDLTDADGDQSALAGMP